METADTTSAFKRRIWVGLALAGTAIHVVAPVASLLLLPKGPDAVLPFLGPATMLITAGIVALGIRVVTDRRLNRRTREAWVWLTVGFAQLTAALVLFALP